MTRMDRAALAGRVAVSDVRGRPIFARRDDRQQPAGRMGRRLARPAAGLDREPCERSSPAPAGRREEKERSMHGRQLVLRLMAVAIALAAALVS